MADRSLRDRRHTLLSDRGMTGRPWCRRYAAEADNWLRDRFADAVGPGEGRGLALVAVGGYGCGELAPGSDLDLVLVHDRRQPPAALAEALWYPIWDQGVHLDHSVRTIDELRSAMSDDLKVALGWLQARPVAGDAVLAAEAVARATGLWHKRAGRWLPQVAEAVAERHGAQGDLAFLLEPDLKDARGGTRDIRLLDAIAHIDPALGPVAGGEDLDGAEELLTAVRVELQRATGKTGNRLQLQDQDVVAAALGHSDADALMAAVAGAARAVAWAGDDAWRRVRSWLDGPPGLLSRSRVRSLEPGLVLRAGEVGLADDADVAGDQSLALRAAAASAEQDRPLARVALDRLAGDSPAPSGRWPAGVLHALIRILATGRAGTGAIEALDQMGIWVRLLPEWAPVRNRPQRNAYHRFTVDRHLLEAAANAADLVRSVSRPDLLLAGALLHDIGKGRGGDHTDVGIDLVGTLAPRMGFDESDTATLVSMVRLHLLLPEAATRRDLDDPQTIRTVADAVGDADTLLLLAALSEADGLATGVSAWSPWKAGLVATLVARTAAHLAGTPHARTVQALTPGEQAMVDAGSLSLVADEGRVTIASPDRTGLLSVVTGVLALSGVTVRSARTRTETGEQMAVLVFDVTPTFAVLPDWDRVRSQLAAALDGRVPLDHRLDERERAYAGRRRPEAPHLPEVRVSVDQSAGSSATVVEVRGPDSGPVLYRITRAVADLGVRIDHALVSTFGNEAIDAFYLMTPEGAKLDEATATSVADAVVAALTPR